MNPILRCGVAAIAAGLPFVFPAGAGAQSAAPAGARPYELDRAGRTRDSVPPLVDFETDAAWIVENRNAAAAFVRSSEQRIWGDSVGRLVYRGSGPSPEVRLRPARPVPTGEGFDTVHCWIYGNNWAWTPDPKTPQVTIAAVFADKAGAEFDVALGRINWKEWHLLVRRLTPEQKERAAGATFAGFRITGGTNADDRVLYFDNFAVYTDPLKPLTFAPRPLRGISGFGGRDDGTNTGPGRLPFPNRPQTILPPNLAPGSFTNRITVAGGVYTFTYRGSDGVLTYRLTPATGTLSDIAARWTGRGGEIRPCVDGGVYLASPGGPVAPEKAEHQGTRRSGDTVVSKWILRAGDVAQPVTYTYRLWGKSLVVDVVAPGGGVAEVRYGRSTGLQNARLVTNPYYGYAPRQRPAVAVSGSASAPLFLTGNTDWYLSGASALWSRNAVAADGATYNGGTRYTPRTDGTRADCVERLFLTVTPRYEEALPVIANPPTPWRAAMATRLWRAHGASNREKDAAYWSHLHRYGITEMVVTDHETMWRDGGESFTFRTETAPGRGGDASQFSYTRHMVDTLGYLYGPYNNFTDLAPVNAFWDTDRVNRTPDGQLQAAWARCYAPKPAFAVEACALLAPQIQAKFGFRTAYCDVHTAVAPWDRVDYDSRVPGAGTFAGTFYAYGEIMLHQKAAWNGPVYSEGGYQSFYSGLADGNYAQDRSGNLANDPWLVDFDLLRIHPLSTNLGMGNPSMFYGDKAAPSDPAAAEARLDRFLAATVAFGHTGFLESGNLASGLRSYYMLQQLQARCALADAAAIRYADAGGKLLDTTAAVASGVYTRSQVVVRYTDGTWTAVNGNPTERMAVTVGGRTLDLPPNGYAGWSEEGAVDVLSTDIDGRRADYAATPAYLYVDGRGRFTRFASAAGNGIGICRRIGKNRFEVIPVNGAECGFAIDAQSVVAVDADRKPLGPASVRVSRGLTYIQPVPGALSYIVEGAPAAPTGGLSAARDIVLPGEAVSVGGAARPFSVTIPADAKPGQRIWEQHNGQWIDFTVAPVAEVETVLEGALGETLRLRMISRLPAPAEFSIVSGGREKKVTLPPRVPTDVRLELGEAEATGVRPLPVDIAAASPDGRFRDAVLTRRLDLTVDIASEPIVLSPLSWTDWTGGMRQRRGLEVTDFGDTGASVAPSTATAGGAALPALALHPPYRGGVGYAYALSGPVAVPATEKPAFRALVGKRDGSDPGDGILFRLVVVADGVETTVREETVTKHEWRNLEGDLTPWAGKTVRLKLIADVGPSDDSSGDWAAIAQPRIESSEPRNVRRLAPEKR